MNNQKCLIVIIGPTATGKTNLSIELANYFNTDVISADSRQFYKELKIGAAPPSDEKLKTVKHHFIHHLSIKDNYNAGKYEKECLIKIKNLFEKKDKLILVGGSRLYINAITKGIDDIPDTPLKIRNKIIRLYEKEGISSLRKILKEKDPKYYNQVDLNNQNRLIRAIEVIYNTDKPFSHFRKNIIKERNFNIIYISIKMDREEIYNRINIRVDKMIEYGLLNEVKSLLPYRHFNSLQTVGYKELFKYIDGEFELKDAINKIKQNTRRFAKRQITWLNSEKSVNYFKINELNKIISFIE